MPCSRYTRANSVRPWDRNFAGQLAEYLRVRGPLNIAFGGRWYCLSVPGRCAVGGHWRPTARVFMT
jgi:hypothetical protein